MRIRAAIAAGAVVLAAATGCAASTSHPGQTASPSAAGTGLSGQASVPGATHAPPVSAGQACLDFDKWYLGTSNATAPLTNIALLQRAVGEAPSGQLYQDMNGTLQFVIQDYNAVGGASGAGATTLISDAYTVTQDCSTVNPNG